MLRGTREYRKRDEYFSPTGLSPTMAALSRAIRLNIRFVTLRPPGTTINRYPTTPLCQRAPAYSRVGLGCYPFAHHYLGNHCYFLFLGVLRCFNSPRHPTTPMYSVQHIPCGMGCPIRKSTGQSVFAAHRSLSQLATSFVGNRCQGIHHMLFLS